VPCTNEAEIADVRLTTRVNGELRQDDRTSWLIFGFRYLIRYISTFTTLVPGDVIVTERRPAPARGSIRRAI
jgi:2-keto-4-pentenoate hydratase/2-oxohepta-3-ene-1,7-dioic acid hydratase in catechol pathway